MREIKIVQVDFDGKGNERIFKENCKSTQLTLKLRRIEAGYNMENTKVFIDDEEYLF